MVVWMMTGGSRYKRHLPTNCKIYFLYFQSNALPVIKILVRTEANHREMYASINHEPVSAEVHELTRNNSDNVPQDIDPQVCRQHHFQTPIRNGIKKARDGEKLKYARVEYVQGALQCNPSRLLSRREKMNSICFSFVKWSAVLCRVSIVMVTLACGVHLACKLYHHIGKRQNLAE